MASVVMPFPLSVIVQIPPLRFHQLSWKSRCCDGAVRRDAMPAG